MPIRDPGFPCDGADGSLWDGEILAENDPYQSRYNWPLKVGRSLRTEYTWTDNVIHPEWSGPSWQEWTVVAWEEVTVPAGSFMAYKVARTKGSWETAREDLDMVWYAPEIPGTVKNVWHRSPNDGYGGAEHMWEMVSYDLK